MTGQRGTVQAMAEAMGVDPGVIREAIEKLRLKPERWEGGEPVYAVWDCVSAKLVAATALLRRIENTQLAAALGLACEPGDRAPAPVGTTRSPGARRHRGGYSRHRRPPTLPSREPAARGPRYPGQTVTTRQPKKGGAQ